MSYIQTAKSTADIVTLRDAKSFMKISGSAEDSIIQAMIYSAVEMAENYMCRDILTTTWQGYFDTFYTDIALKRAKFQSLESIDYLVDDTYTNLASTEYVVKKGGIYGFICKLNAPGDIDSVCDAVRITFKTGWGDTADDVPSSLKLAIQNMVLYLYENRGECSCVDDFPAHIKYTLRQYRAIDIYGGVDSVVCM